MNDLATKLSKLGACGEAIAYANTMPDLASAWTACRRGNWMEWLLNKLDAWPAGALADYAAKRAPLYADYEAKRAPLYADYEAKRAPLYADYEAKLAPLEADFAAKLADMLRSIVPTVVWSGLAGRHR